MNKHTVIITRTFLFLTVIFALYHYYPFADRIFATLINIDSYNSIRTLTAKNYVFTIIFHLVSFIVGFLVLPGIFLFFMWQLTKKVKTVSTHTRKSSRGSRVIKHRTIAEVDEKSLKKIYNQLRHIELEIDSKFQSLNEELLTEINSEILRMFNMKTEADNCVEKARTLLRTEDYDEALKACNKAVELTPFGAAYYVRGAVYHKMGIDEQALNDLNTAATLGYQKALDVLSVMGVAS